jgi:ribosomal protein S18 acetylase RimI-like enzyme
MREIRAVSEGHVDELLGLYRQTWWAADRIRDQVISMLAGTDLVFGFVDDESRLVAFARVVTDGKYFAMILDVIVSEELRGTGLGERLMNAVLRRPELAGLKSVELVCQPDLIAFYERFGFTTEVRSSRLMRRTTDPLLSQVQPR